MFGQSNGQENGEGYEQEIIVGKPFGDAAVEKGMKGALCAASRTVPAGEHLEYAAREERKRAGVCPEIDSPDCKD